MGAFQSAASRTTSALAPQATAAAQSIYDFTVQSIDGKEIKFDRFKNKASTHNECTGPHIMYDNLILHLLVTSSGAARC